MRASSTSYRSSHSFRVAARSSSLLMSVPLSPPQTRRAGASTSNAPGAEATKPKAEKGAALTQAALAPSPPHPPRGRANES